MSELSFGEVGEILQLLQGIDGSEVDLEWGDLKIQVRRGATTAASTGAADRPPSETAAFRSADVAVQSAAAYQSETAVPTHTEPAKAEDGSDAEGSPLTDSIPDHWTAITAPMAGTFYRASKPEDPPFVEVGDTVAPGDTVGLIEVMKLYTELKAEVMGKVSRIDAADSTLVEFGHPLVWIEPA